MQIEREEPEMFRVSMTRDELRILCNAVGEVFETIDEWEIPIRLGVEVEELRTHHEHMLAAYRDS